MIAEQKIVHRMTIPQSQHLPDLEDDRQYIGFWFEATDQKGTTLYKRLIRNPISERIELYNEDGSFENIIHPVEDITFEILIPHDDKIRNIKLYRSRIDEKKRVPVLEELTTLDILGSKKTRSRSSKRKGGK